MPHVADAVDVCRKVSCLIVRIIQYTYNSTCLSPSVMFDSRFPTPTTCHTLPPEVSCFRSSRLQCAKERRLAARCCRRQHVSDRRRFSVPVNDDLPHANGFHDVRTNDDELYLRPFVAICRAFCSIGQRDSWCQPLATRCRRRRQRVASG